MAKAACALLVLMFAAGSIRQEDAAWKAAVIAVEREKEGKNPQALKRALEDLANATYDRRDRQTVQVVLGILDIELKDDAPDGKKEDRIDGRILEGCEMALSRVTNKDAVGTIIRYARARNVPMRFRFHLCRALGHIKSEKVVKALIEIASEEKHTDPRVHIAALDGLLTQGDKAALTVFLKSLADEKKIWECRLTALRGVEKIGDIANAEALIDILAKCKPHEGILKVEIMRVLGKFLDVKDPKTDEPNWWRGALADKKAGRKPGENAGSTTVETTEFFGLKTKSTRIVFILDRTGSMDFPCSEEAKKQRTPGKKEEPKGEETPGASAKEKAPEKEKEPEKADNPVDEAARRQAAEIKKKHDDRKIEKRMDALKKEFINTIYRLDPRVQFTVIWYEGNPTPWKEQLVPATWPNKLECIKDIDGLTPSGGTNIWDALEIAYRYVADPRRNDVPQIDKNGNYATVVNGPDTFFLMTDGNHNQGRFTKGGPPPGGFDENAFFAEFKKVNDLRKVVVNTIILGDRGDGNQDPIRDESLSLFKRIAEASNGKFLHIGK
ncbi:MAG: hypothetical protein HY716_06950 [Planctomycetes bacterium]|nr:hypothetical protein [Planctomycetota bacterium]